MFFKYNDEYSEKLGNRIGALIASNILVQIITPILINGLIETDILEKDFYNVFENGFNFGTFLVVNAILVFFISINKINKLSLLRKNISKCYVEFKENCFCGVGYENIYELHSEKYFELGYDEIREIVVCTDKNELQDLTVYSPAGTYKISVENVHEAVQLLSQKVGISYHIDLIDRDTASPIETGNTEYYTDVRSEHTVYCPYCDGAMSFDRNTMYDNMEVYCPHCNNLIIIDTPDE